MQRNQNIVYRITSINSPNKFTHSLYSHPCSP
nr:MAG TPA: hypothetical protein [Caudoviricetes sp.]